MEKKHNILALIWNHPYVILLVSASGFGEFQLGYHTGIINGALIMLKEEFLFKDGPHTDFIRNAVFIGALAGSIAGGASGDFIGRKKCLAAGATLSFLGSFLSGMDPNLAYIMVGRFFIGVGIGMGTVVSPILIAESSPPESRARLITASALLVTIGQFCAYFVTILSTKVSPLWSWRTRFGFGSVAAIIQVALISALHESPVFLAKKEKFEECRQSIKKTHPSEEAEIEVERLKGVVTGSAADKGGQNRNVYLSLVASKLLWSCVLLQVAQQAVGIDFLISSAPRIIQLGGLNSNNTVIDLALIVSAFSFIGFVGCFVVGDKVQRKRQLMASFTIVMFGYIAFSMVSYDSKVHSPAITMSAANCSVQPPLNDCYNCLKKQCGFCANVDTKEKLVPGTCLAYVDDCTKGENNIWYDLGCPNRTGFFPVIVLGCLLIFGFPTICTTPIVINSEVHDFKNRSFKTGFVATAGWLGNFLINKLLSPYLESLPDWSAFLVFGFSTLIGLITLNFLVIPDLRGKRPNEMERPIKTGVH